MGEIDGAFRAWGIPRGGTGGCRDAIACAARALGAEIRTEAPVARIIVKAAARPASRSRSGEEIDARRRAVLGRRAADVPRRCSSPGTLEHRFEDEVRRFKFRGSSGKVNLAVDRLPDFTACRARRAPPRRDHLQPSID